MPFDINEINKLAELIPSVINRIVTQHRVNTNVEQVEPVLESYDFSSEKFDLQELELFLKKYNILIIPSGTTSERPTQLEGSAIRYNTETNKLDFYNGSTWLETATDDVIYQNLTFSGSNIYFVSKAYGTANGKKGNILAPYNNPWTVASLMQSGDIMWVLDGIYTATDVGGGGDKEVTATASSQSLIPTTWTSGEYTMYFAEGTRVEDNSTVAQSSGYLFNITQPITLNILGQGDFYKFTANGGVGSRNFAVIRINNTSGIVNFNANLIQCDKGQVMHVATLKELNLYVNKAQFRWDFGITFELTQNALINLNIDEFVCEKSLTTNVEYTWEAIRLRSMNNCVVNAKFNKIDIYGLYAILNIQPRDASPNFANTIVNIQANDVKYTNDSTGANITTFGTLAVGQTDNEGNSVSGGCRLIHIQRVSGELQNSEININVQSATGNRLRLFELDLASSPINNTVNINVNNYYSTNCNAIDINTLRGATNIINLNCNNAKITTGALINQADTSSAAKLYLSGVWESNANAAIINAAGPGIVLKDFVGKGGSTASPITTSGSGNVAVLSAAFNNTTTITGTVVGATPIQNAAF